MDDLIVCYTDAAWKKDTNLAAFGCIFTDKRGTVISQASRVETNVPSPLISEALAHNGHCFRPSPLITQQSVSTQIASRV
uniref:RNase H type-1 domain-containing protein n=1 Tax=Brassica oleracea TaxID=3712 RepID=A0A3P6G2L5_BRAOL|nr:unnamed protein product [Brassica oleracea]